MELRAQGFGARRIIARTGITKHYVSKILYGTQKRTPSSLASAYEKPQSGARAEARCFAHMVQAGEITQEQAEADIGISPADRAALEAFAAKHVCRAKMVQAALRLRDATLLEFRRILANATQPL